MQIYHGRSQEGGGAERVCAPPPEAFEPPAGRRAARVRTPAGATETLTEVTKSVRKPTKTRQGSRDHLGPPEKRGPCD